MVLIIMGLGSVLMLKGIPPVKAVLGRIIVVGIIDLLIYYGLELRVLGGLYPESS